VYEILAIVAGVVIGLIAARLSSTALKIATIIMGSVAVGAIVSSISGELSISWGFLVFDIRRCSRTCCTRVGSPGSGGRPERLDALRRPRPT
jgi:hypothetical protein